MSPFDFLNQINFGKEDIFDGEESERDYVPFVINRTLSYSPDAVMWANEMNRAEIPKEWQFDFLLRVIPKKKRYTKWEKKVAVSEDIALISESYKYSTAKALEVSEILTPQQIEYIKDQMNKGGKNARSNLL